MTTTLGQLLKLDYKKNSMTLEEFNAAMKAALNNPLITAIPPPTGPALILSLTALTTAIDVYLVTKKLIKQVQEITPAVKKATKVGGLPTNPANSGEIADDLGKDAVKAVKVSAKDAIKAAKDTVLNSVVIP